MNVTVKHFLRYATFLIPLFDGCVPDGVKMHAINSEERERESHTPLCVRHLFTGVFGFNRVIAEEIPPLLHPSSWPVF